MMVVADGGVKGSWGNQSLFNRAAAAAAAVIHPTSNYQTNPFVTPSLPRSLPCPPPVHMMRAMWGVTGDWTNSWMIWYEISLQMGGEHGKNKGKIVKLALFVTCCRGFRLRNSERRSTAGYLTRD